MSRFLPVIVLAAVASLATPRAVAATQSIGGNPGPQYNYICPNADGQGALDCYFDAVQHLYTMCRNVKAIEIIEFGYEDSVEGLHNAKYEYCLDKQKRNMAAPYQAALKEARVSRQAVEAVQSLHEHWLASLHGIKWNRGESDEAYKTRTLAVYDEFKAKIDGVRTIVAIVKDRTTPAATGKGAAKPAAKAAKPAAQGAKPAAPKAVTGTPNKAPQT
jgi:hypothetical protein